MLVFSGMCRVSESLKLTQHLKIKGMEDHGFLFAMSYFSDSMFVSGNVNAWWFRLLFRFLLGKDAHLTNMFLNELKPQSR